VIEGKIKRGLVAAAGHTLKFTTSSVEFTLYIYTPKHIKIFFKKKHKRKSNRSAPGFFHSGNLL
jgi:hypothetical protein